MLDGEGKKDSGLFALKRALDPDNLIYNLPSLIKL